jgi:nucleoside-diphosphate-sugar epimerase
MSDNGIHVIFGTGPLGLTVMKQLLLQGKRVRMVNRSGLYDVPKDVEIKKWDACNEEGISEICKGASVIYHCMGLPYQEWKDKLPLMMRGVIQGAVTSNAKIVYADNIYAYGTVNGKMHEELPYKPVGKKTQVRADVANMLMESHQSGKIRAAIGRGPDFFGPGACVATLGSRVFENMILDKPVELLGKPELSHSHIFLRDFAVGLITLGQHDTALGQIWHLPCAETLSTQALVDKLAKKIGKKIKYRVANRAIVTMFGIFNPIMREFKELMYQFDKPLIMDYSKYERAFGIDITPHDEAIAQTFDYFNRKVKARS